MRIIHVAAELAPIAKVGGLADVMLGLPRAQAKLGHDVAIIIPKYDSINHQEISNLSWQSHPFQCTYDGQLFQNNLKRSFYKGIALLLLESGHPENFFNRVTIYGCNDDIDRFLYFSRAAADYLITTQPDIVHIHDWQAAAIASMLPDEFKTILTIHNMAYQGECPKKSLTKAGLSGTTTKLLADPNKKNRYNLLAGGIRCAKYVTTVSPTYAKEVLTKQFGCGLENVLKKKGSKFKGILNGLDTDYWNPATDPHLPYHFDEKSVKEKSKLRDSLCQQLNIDNVPKKPLIASVTRLVPQKGPELIKKALQHTLKKEGLFILLGSSPIDKIQKEFKKLQKSTNKDINSSIVMEYNEDLAHQIYAGADLFIVPSHFEPCGLTQMIALRYGTLPLVRTTGGLADTIVDVKSKAKKPNGFTFKQPTATALTTCLTRAFNIWNKSPQKWKQMQKYGMKTDFSWKRSAKEYLKLYS